MGALVQVFAALSLFALFQHAVRLGLSSAFAMLLSVYIRAVDLTVGLLDPTIKDIISFFNSLFHIHITFQPGWRYIFIILQMLFVRDAGTALSDGRGVLAAIRLFVGTTISVTCSILIFIPTPHSNLVSNMTFCVIPVIGLLVYDISMYAFSATLFFDQVGIGELSDNRSRSHFFLVGLKRSLFRFFVVAVPSLLLFATPALRRYPFPDGGVIAILAGCVANSVYWLLHGASYAMAQARLGKRFRKAFFASEAGRFGLAVSGVLFWVLVFCVLNAGGRLVGL